MCGTDLAFVCGNDDITVPPSQGRIKPSDIDKPGEVGKGLTIHDRPRISDG